jgi:hypothetical protein
MTTKIRILLPVLGFAVAATICGAQLQEPVGPISGTAPAAAPVAPSQPSAPAAPAAKPVPATSAVQNDPSALVRRNDETSSGAAAANAKVQVPTGTHLPLVLHNAISTRSAQKGDPVYFETTDPVIIDGRVVIPAGSYVSGEVVEAKRAGRVKGRAAIAVRLTTMILPNAYVVSLAATPSNAGTGGGETTNNEGTVVGDSDKATDVGTVVRATEVGGGTGALIGLAAGHAGEGGVIGLGAGAAAGLAAVLLSRGPDAEMPRGTTVEVVLDHPILLDADKVQFTSPGTSTPLSGPPNREPQRQKLPF